MTLNIAERHAEILKQLELIGSVNVNELSKEFNVSQVTIRKDLKLLEERKLLYRSHGKAIPSNPYITEYHVNIKEKLQTKEKTRIATAASSMLQPGDSIIIASGTSLTEFARHIKNIDECPLELKSFIKKIEDFTGNSISLISYGPDRNQTFAL